MLLLYFTTCFPCGGISPRLVGQLVFLGLVENVIFGPGPKANEKRTRILSSGERLQKPDF